MPNDLHNYSDEVLLSEVARRLGLRASTSRSDDSEAGAVRLHFGVPMIEIPDGLAAIKHDAEAIRRLLEANNQRLGLRRCEIGEAFRKAGRQALNIDQKVQYLIARNELVGESGADGRTYWRLAGSHRPPQVEAAPVPFRGE